MMSLRGEAGHEGETARLADSVNDKQEVSIQKGEKQSTCSHSQVGSSSSRGYLWGHRSMSQSMHKQTVKPSNFTHYALSISISLSALFFALIIPNMSTIFSYLGSVCSSYLCLHLPAAFVKKMKAIEKAYFNDEDGPSRYEIERDAESRPQLRSAWTEPGIPDDLLNNIMIEILYYGGIVAGVASVVVTAISS